MVGTRNDGPDSQRENWKEIVSQSSLGLTLVYQTPTVKSDNELLQVLVRVANHSPVDIPKNPKGGICATKAATDMVAQYCNDSRESAP